MRVAGPVAAAYSGIALASCGAGRDFAACAFAVAPTWLLSGFGSASGCRVLSRLGGSYDTPPGAKTRGLPDDLAYWSWLFVWYQNQDCLAPVVASVRALRIGAAGYSGNNLHYQQVVLTTLLSLLKEFSLDLGCQNYLGCHVPVERSESLKINGCKLLRGKKTFTEEVKTYYLVVKITGFIR